MKPWLDVSGFPGSGDRPGFGHSSTLYSETMTPTWRLVEAYRLLDLCWDFDADCACIRKQHDIAGFGQAVASGDEASRTFLSLVAPGGCLARPEIIVADDETGLRIRTRHPTALLEQAVKRRMFGVHFSSLDSVDDHGRRVGRSMGPLGRGHQPIVLRG